MLIRFLRFVRNGMDVFVSWILWSPTRPSRAISLSTGMIFATKERYARKAFKRAMRFKFYRSAVEILVLSRISVPKERVTFLFEQCLARAYFGRATLLVSQHVTEERGRLREQLEFVGEHVLADHVAMLMGEPIGAERTRQTLTLFAYDQRRSGTRRAMIAGRLAIVPPHGASKHSTPPSIH